MQSDHPVDSVLWVPAEKVIANDYNPNSVAKTEMSLLYLSIKHDGLTQPVVTVYDEEIDKYVIVDGFHRHLVIKNYPDILESTDGCIPVVVIKKNINDRMASTVRHNRARGSHSVAGMSKIVFEMLGNGWPDEQICNEMGLEPDELLRLKHITGFSKFITGFSKLFKDIEYSKAWETRRQLQLKKEYLSANPTDHAGA